MIELLFVITSVAMVVALVASFVAWRAMSENRRRSEARVARLADVLRSAEPADSAPVEVSHLLASNAVRRGFEGPALAAVMATIVVGLTAAMFLLKADARTPSPVHASTPVSSRAEPTSLELVSLTHERGPDGELELRGAVHNPQAGTTLEDVTVVAMLFDRDGTFVASRRAPLEARTVARGADATFVIDVPDADAVGRYRVSFRTERGIIPHTDRRTEH